MAADPAPEEVWHIDGEYHFNGEGEKAKKSPSYVQNLLTALGCRVEHYSCTKENGCGHEILPPYENMKGFKLCVKADRMSSLILAPVLRIRNGFDISSVVYSVNNFYYRGTIVVRYKPMKTFIKQKMRVNRHERNLLKWRIEGDQDSEEQAGISMALTNRNHRTVMSRRLACRSLILQRRRRRRKKKGLN